MLCIAVPGDATVLRKSKNVHAIRLVKSFDKLIVQVGRNIVKDPLTVFDFKN